MILNIKFVKHFFVKVLLLNYVLFFSVKISAQDIAIKTRLENIKIESDTSFVKHVHVLLKKSNNSIEYPVVYDGDLEEISDIQVYVKKGKRFKPAKNLIVIEEDVDLDYIANKKVKIIIIPPEVEAKITYTIKCRELMYFSDLRFFSNNDIDTLKFRISVPKAFCFKHNTIYKDSLNYMSIDSIKTDNFIKWYIEVTPVKVDPDPLLFFGIYKNIKMPLMRTVILPSSYENNELEYMNDWYLSKAETKRGLDGNVITKINELTKGISDPMKVLDILYDYVKNNFKYVAIEIGMGAFIPSHVNEVFVKKQGDCKDLSNFLSEILNYKGIKSNIALAATYSHISDCDFPSLSSANHVICVANIKDKPILLDPTDPIHLPNTPVQSLQKRTILIINSNGGKFYKVNDFSLEQNLIHYEIELEANSSKMLMKGKFKTHYNGISGNFLKRELIYANEDKVNDIGKKHYESIFGNQTINDFKFNDRANIIDVEGKIEVSGKVFDDEENKFLFIDFLPRIIETESRETLLEGTHLGSCFKKTVNLSIKMDHPIETIKPIEYNYSNNGVSLHLKVISHSDFIIECNYEFEFDYFNIEKGNLTITNDILKSFKKIINEPIILRKKA